MTEHEVIEKFEGSNDFAEDELMDITSDNKLVVSNDIMKVDLESSYAKIQVIIKCENRFFRIIYGDTPYDREYFSHSLTEVYPKFEVMVAEWYSKEELTNDRLV